MVDSPHSRMDGSGRETNVAAEDARMKVYKQS